tara:strand:- start:7192 stop:7899 length:708 start_codon:yes stop_codon:yes gene_type:complete
MKRNNLFFCDRCYKEGIDIKTEEVVSRYYECYTKQHWIKHIQTPKHKAHKEQLNKSNDCIKCGECGERFSAEGYERHKKRNEAMWKYKKIAPNDSRMKDIVCNNFCVGNKRYESFDDLKLSFVAQKPKQRRARIGQNGRGKNKTTKEVVEESEDKEPEEEKQEEEKKKKTKKVSCDIIKNDDDRLSDDDLEQTEKPTFDEFCDDCSLPINYNYSVKICKLWDIETCGCPTEDESE